MESSTSFLPSAAAITPPSYWHSGCRTEPRITPITPTRVRVIGVICGPKIVAYSAFGRGAGDGLANLAASMGTFGCSWLSSVVAWPFVHVVVQRNGSLTPET